MSAALLSQDTTKVYTVNLFDGYFHLFILNAMDGSQVGSAYRVQNSVSTGYVRRVVENGDLVYILLYSDTTEVCIYDKVLDSLTKKYRTNLSSLGWFDINIAPTDTVYLAGKNMIPGKALHFDVVSLYDEVGISNTLFSKFTLCIKSVD